MATSSQKFIARNRAPRVQIEYDVELYGAEKKVQLPFVMGVLSDLSGKPAEPLPPVAERKLLDFDVDNFDSRMKSMKPRVAFQVPNTLTGEGNMSVDITFENMDDFSPAAVARNIARERFGRRSMPRVAITKKPTTRSLGSAPFGGRCRTRCATSRVSCSSAATSRSSLLRKRR